MSAIPPELAAQARRVLVINVTRIGDTLLTTPALRAISRFFPNAEITFLGHPKRVEVLEHLPYLAAVGAITKNSARLRGWFGTPFDWAFVWGEDDALVRYARRAARRVVAQRPHDAALAKSLYCAVDLPHAASVHAVALALAVTDAVGIPRCGLGLDAVVSSEERAWATAWVASLRGTDAGPLIGMLVASFPTKAYRDWPIGHFASLIGTTLAQHPNARFVVFGGDADRTRGAQLKLAFPDQVNVVAGELSLRQTAALMQQMHCYVGVDSGPTHLFAALSRSAQPPRPMVVIYHPSIPSALYKPLEHPRLYAIDHPLAAPGCSREVAIGDIRVERVAAALHAALQGSPAQMERLLLRGLRARLGGVVADQCLSGYVLRANPTVFARAPFVADAGA